MVKEVLLVFKTHLDIGYTDYAEKVVERYLKEFIPNAIRAAYALKDTDTPFIWSTGAWLIWEALKHDADGRVAQAIRDGLISWHALPYTSHTEAMNKKLFEYGLSLSEKLDARFGKKTIGAKMTDVPGHTLGMVEILKAHGIEFLHIGVNEATPVPPVPTLFRWKCGESEINMMYGSGYGSGAIVGETAVEFGFTEDNCGPQDLESIKKQYAALRQKYPGATVRAATLDDVAACMRTCTDLPVIEQEIGDTWIHGIATDPKKLSLYRDLMRHVEENGIGDKDITDNLLLVPEHTWGMCIAMHYPDFKNYLPADFKKSEGSEMRRKVEKSWQEQRAYIDKAQAVLGTDYRYEVVLPDIEKMQETAIPALGFEISWQLFDFYSYEWFKHVYCRIIPFSLPWFCQDFTKPGLPYDFHGGIYTAKPVKAWSDGDVTVVQFAFDAEIATAQGLPQFYAVLKGESIEIQWHGMQANRMPNAYWLKFTGMEENWEIHKLGKWIAADAVIGSPLICGFEKGVRNADFEILSLDAGLAAPYGRRLLDWEAKPQGQDMYFNLYNNIWNTNFPMWYSDDARFRFEIVKR